MYPTHTVPIGCTMLVPWPHKYKVGHIDLILIYHHNLLNSPDISEFSCLSHTPTIKIMSLCTQAIQINSTCTYMYTKIVAIYHLRAHNSH